MPKVINFGRVFENSNATFQVIFKHCATAKVFICFGVAHTTFTYCEGREKLEEREHHLMKMTTHAWYPSMPKINRVKIQQNSSEWVKISKKSHFLLFFKPFTVGKIPKMSYRNVTTVGENIKYLNLLKMRLFC